MGVKFGGIRLILCRFSTLATCTGQRFFGEKSVARARTTKTQTLHILRDTIWPGVSVSTRIFYKSPGLAQNGSIRYLTGVGYNELSQVSTNCIKNCP